MGGTDDWPAYRDRQLKAAPFIDTIAMWCDVFGPENVNVDVLGQDAVQQFLDYLQFEMPQVGSQTQNKSMSALGVAQLLALNKTFERKGKHRPSAVRSAFAAHMVGPSWRAPAADVRMIYAHFDETIRKLAAHPSVSEAGKATISHEWNVAAVEKGLRQDGDVYRDGADGMTDLLYTLFER